MVEYWLDANVFITPFRQGFYSFALAPGFWGLLDQKASEGIIASCTMVYEELAKGKTPDAEGKLTLPDELAIWAKARQNTNLFVVPDATAQTSFREVADYCKSSYAEPLCKEFLSDADPWLVAFAKAKGGKVVTFENRKGNGSSKIKLPSICDHFGVQCKNLYEMLGTLGKFEIGAP